MKITKKIRETKKKMKDKYYKVKSLAANSYIYHHYYHSKLDENAIFVSSRDGKDFTGNIFWIVEELSKDEYKSYKIYVYAKKEVWPKIKLFTDNYGLKKLHLISSENKAVAVMEQVKYIVSDSGVPWKYVKREGQVVLNTWHGTPLKVMGRQIAAEKHVIGTAQHFFFSSDYLLYPSRYMKDTMLRSYMVDNIISGKALMGGYPRNSVFFDAKRNEKLKEKLGYKDKQVLAYMPTHRGRMGKEKHKEQLQDVLDYLTEIDAYLTDNQIMLVKLHVFNQSKIDFAQFQNIKPFPEEYETYDVLNIADMLITDYSSVFFDYANTRRKIILFAYDEKEYFEDRGTYFALSELPFPKVLNAKELLREINTPKNYDDSLFLKKYCTYDNKDATQALCKHVFKQQKVLDEERLGNGKENVLIYGGSLAKNGITTALVSLLNNIDKTKRNYYVSFQRREVNSDPDRVDVIPKDIDYLPLMCDQQYTLGERWAYECYCRSKDINTKYPALLKRLFEREWKRYYWGAEFSNLIQFDGYGKNVNMLFLSTNIRKTIFVHNNMINELKYKTVQHPLVLNEAYNHFDHVAIVSPDLLEPTLTVGANKEKIMVVNNVHDVNEVRRKAELPISFEKDTECVTNNINGINGVLTSSGKKFITIGRFSPEKGHKRLLQAFDLFCKNYPDTQLIIIGGHGVLYNDTIQLMKSMTYWKNVTIIKSIKNPMPILQKCDLFVLPSHYEGLGLVLLEADCLGIPSFSTDIIGPRQFMQKYRGYLVEDSESGILQGMYDYMNGKITTFHIDYDEYNEIALNNFEELF